MNNGHETLIDIDQTTRLTGLSKVTLQNCGRRYQFPTPARLSGGLHLYLLKQVGQLGDVVDRCQMGSRPFQAVISSTPTDNMRSNSVLDVTHVSDEIRLILNSLYKYDQQTAESLLSKLEERIFQNEWPGRLVFGGPGLSAMEAQLPKSSHIFFVNGDLNRSNLILSALSRRPQQLENRGLR